MTIETANRLLELRKQHNLSQEELAEKLGVSRQAVSKWERSEASPDTDNLISLAKLYNLTLDELIFGGKQSKEQETSKNATENKESTEESNDEGEEKNKTEVKIGPTGILVKSDDGDVVKIGLTGIKIEASNSKSEQDDENDEDENNDDDEINIKTKKSRFWLELPYPIICSVAYLIFGFCDILGGWSRSWIIFITIPIYYSLVEAIYNKRFDDFAYPVFTAFAYLYMGLYHYNWHPSWLVFVTIPIYYFIADALDKTIKRHQQKSTVKIEINED